MSAAFWSSRVAAVSCNVPPNATLAGLGDTTTDATGTSVTVTTVCPVVPSLVAVMVASPGATPVTSPLCASTLATAAALVLHATSWPVSVLFDASCVFALSCSVRPTNAIGLSGAMTTLATAGCAGGVVGAVGVVGDVLGVGLVASAPQAARARNASAPRTARERWAYIDTSG